MNIKTIIEQTKEWHNMNDTMKINVVYDYLLKNAPKCASFDKKMIQIFLQDLQDIEADLNEQL